MNYFILILLALLTSCSPKEENKKNFEKKVEALATFTDTSTADPDFGDPITNSTTRIFTFKNTGDTPGAANPNFTGSNPTDFSIILQTGCAMVNPGSTCTVRVNFNPSGKTTGRYSADLNIGNSIFKSLQTRVDTSSGTTAGGTSTIEATVSSVVISNPLDYGSFSGTQSSTKIIRLKNTGTTSTGPHTAALSDTDFTFTLNGCSNKILAPNAYCDVRVTFSATSKTAQDYLTDLTFAGHSFPLKATVAASGGTTTSGGTPSIAILEGTNPAADPLNYGSFSGTQSLTKILTIKNTGTSSVVVNPTLGNTDFTFILNSCSNKTLAPNGSCSVRVTFSTSGKTSGPKATILNVHPSKSITLEAGVNLYTLSVDFNPNVNVSGSSINCGITESSCSSQIINETIIGLSANPAQGYRIVSWNLSPGCTLLAPTVTYCFINNGSIHLASPILGCADGYVADGQICSPEVITYQPVYSQYSLCSVDEPCEGQGEQTRSITQCDKLVNGNIVSSVGLEFCDSFNIPANTTLPCDSPAGNVLVNISNGQEQRSCAQGSETQTYVAFSRECNIGYIDDSSACISPLGLSAGNRNSCAINSLGQNYCWGNGDFGQIFPGTGTYSNTPVATSGFSGNLFTSVSLGFYSNCLVHNGLGYCWGYQDSGQAYGTLGNGSLSTSYSPTQVSSLSGLTKIDSGGYYHTCAISSGNPYCWGFYGVGAISGGRSSTTPIALPLGSIPSGSTTHIAAGWQLTCFIANEKGYCLGYGREGQVGNGLNNDNNSTPQALAGGLSSKKVTDITAAFGACAIADGEAYCWGVNGLGQLGLGNNSNVSTPTKVIQNTGLAGKKITAISMGGVGGGGSSYSQSHTCSIAQGEAYCWGSNNSGQLGNGNNTSSNVPVKVKNDSGPLFGKFLVSIQSGDTHTCVRDNQGYVYCWGDNASGQLGNGNNTSSNVPVQSSFTP